MATVKLPCEKCALAINVDKKNVFFICLLRHPGLPIQHPSQNIHAVMRFLCPRHGWTIQDSQLHHLFTAATTKLSITYIAYPVYTPRTGAMIDEDDYIAWGLATDDSVNEAARIELYND